MELTVKELKENIFNYLESTIKNTPQNFKDLIEAIILFKEKCNTNLSVFAGLEFNAWGDFRGGVIRIGEGYANEDERILIDSDDFEHFQNMIVLKIIFLTTFAKLFLSSMKTVIVMMKNRLMICMKNYTNHLKKMKNLQSMKKNTYI
ncbi:hypothetical protein CWE04_12010 [Thomasclavelia cocleata]|uniref:hypothetical protein n=1 Tax=Thomasclavelia cocleata TaxID=69824 RepID=UPI000C27D46F|nr:hypothetical protein [Thomasclavelia cocleata]PJN79927.1 hypothetical protein CWE04_12010 [Thomasclavelia cocleata]